MVSDGTITVKNGTIIISSSDDGIHSETSIVFDGGSTTISKSYEGVESMYVYIGYKFLFSWSALTKGAPYSIYTGGSYTGGSSNNGLYTGGTYSGSGATLKKTVTLSSTATVNMISF